MSRLLIPLGLLVLGAGAGAGLGLVLRPVAESAALPVAPSIPAARDYVRLPNQFVVPVMESGRVRALVVLSLSLEVVAGQSDAIYTMEPKLRDEFLRVLFSHANAGGFRGTFTEAGRLATLRRALLEPARKVVGDQVTDVLITDIVRQDS